MTPKVVTVVVHFRAAAGRIDELRSRLGAAVPRLGDLDGCRGGSLYNDMDDADLFVLVEHWDSRAAHEAYLARLEADGTMDQLRPLLEGDPARRYLSG